MKIAKYFINIAVYIVAMVAATLITGCEKELDFEYHDINPLPVIEASLTQEGAEVHITVTTPMGEPMNEAAFTDATVMLLDITSGDEFELLQDADGTFRNPITGISGHVYRLIVSLGGDYQQTFESESCMLPATEILHSQFHWIEMPGDDMAALQLLIADNPLTVDYYWVRLYRNGEPYMWNAITDRPASNGVLEEVLTTTHRDPEQEDEKQLLVDGDIITATVTPINRRMFDYLTALMNGSNGQQQFYGINSSNDCCLGYFLPSPVASATIIYKPDDINYAS